MCDSSRLVTSTVGAFVCLVAARLGPSATGVCRDCESGHCQPEAASAWSDHRRPPLASPRAVRCGRAVQAQLPPTPLLQRPPVILTSRAPWHSHLTVPTVAPVRGVSHSQSHTHACTHPCGRCLLRGHVALAVNEPALSRRSCWDARPPATLRAPAAHWAAGAGCLPLIPLLLLG